MRHHDVRHDVVERAAIGGHSGHSSHSRRVSAAERLRRLRYQYGGVGQLATRVSANENAGTPASRTLQPALLRLVDRLHRQERPERGDVWREGRAAAGEVRRIVPRRHGTRAPRRGRWGSGRRGRSASSSCRSPRARSRPKQPVSIMSPCGAANSAGNSLPASSSRRGPVTMSGSRRGSSLAAPGASTAPWPWSARTSSLSQVAGQPAAQAQLEAGAVEARGVVLEDAGHPSLAREQAHGVAVPDVDEHGVGDAVRQRAVERRRAGVGDERRGVAGEGGRRLGGGAQAGERRRDGGCLVEEVADGPALGHRLLPRARSAARGWSCPARSRGPARRAPRRRTPVPRRAGAGPCVSAAASRSPEATSAAAPSAGAAVLRPRRPRPPRARRARALVEVVGEAGGGRLGGHERAAGGEVRLHRHRHRAAAHDRPAEDHGLAELRRRGDPRTGDLRRRGHDQLDCVLERLAARVRRMSLVPAPTSIARTPAGCAAEVMR